MREENGDRSPCSRRVLNVIEYLLYMQDSSIRSSDEIFQTGDGLKYKETFLMFSNFKF